MTLTLLSEPSCAYTRVSPRAMELLHEIRAEASRVNMLAGGFVTETTMARAGASLERLVELGVMLREEL